MPPVGTFCRTYMSNRVAAAACIRTRRTTYLLSLTFGTAPKSRRANGVLATRSCSFVNFWVGDSETYIYDLGMTLKRLVRQHDRWYNEVTAIETKTHYGVRTELQEDRDAEACVG